MTSRLRPPRRRRDRIRNTVAHRIANFALNHIATAGYRDDIATIVQLGIRECLRPPEQPPRLTPTPTVHGIPTARIPRLRIRREGEQ